LHAIGLAAVAILAAAAPVVIAWAMKLVLDDVTAGHSTRTVTFGVVLAVTGMAAASVPYLDRYLGAELGRRISVTALARLFLTVERFNGLGRFEQPAFLDRLRVAEDASSTAPRQAVHGFVGSLRGLLTGVGFVASVATLYPAMSVLLVVVSIPVLALETRLSRVRTSVLWRISPTQRREAFYSQLLTGLAAAKETRLFGLGRFFRMRMLAERRSADTAQRETDWRALRVQGGLAVTSTAFTGMALVWMLADAGGGRVSTGDVALFVTAVAAVQGALGALVASLAAMYESILLFDHYLDVVNAAPDLPAARHPRAVGPLRQGIEFRDVWFRYSTGQPWVLRGVSFTVRAGQSVAVVGRNGSGKSTLVKLLCRFYDPEHGQVLWDGVDIRALDVSEFRRRIGVVFQDHMCYDLTAAENIGVGDLELLDRPDLIEQAARKADVHDTVLGLRNGYGTLLSHIFVDPRDSGADTPTNPTESTPAGSGSGLSAGQWQRVALARALLRTRAELLILDEPSSGLDPQSEYDLHAKLVRFRNGRASVLISHRLGAIRDADHIVVLSAGQVSEHGDHEALVSGDGEYARLFALQAEGYRNTAAGL
jgi:ATP-binding cassette subfamily B protein